MPVGGPGPLSGGFVPPSPSPVNWRYRYLLVEEMYGSTRLPKSLARPCVKGVEMVYPAAFSRCGSLEAVAKLAKV